VQAGAGDSCGSRIGQVQQRDADGGLDL
jgi:hypothetical protein